MDKESDRESYSSSEGEDNGAINTSGMVQVEIPAAKNSGTSKLNSKIHNDTEVDLSSAVLQSVVKTENIDHDFSLDNSLLHVDVEIANKKVEDVPVRYGCKVEDLGMELAGNESVQVVFYLYEKLKKGGGKCDASNAQVLFRLCPKWKWVPIDDLVDSSLPVGEAFSDLMPYFKLTFNLERKPEQEEVAVEPRPPPAQDRQIINKLTDLLADHTDEELITKECPLSKALLNRLRNVGSLPVMSQDELDTLRKWINDVTGPSTCGSSGKEDASSCHEMNDADDKAKLDAPLSRSRVSFDPKSESTQLKEWFTEDPSPSRDTIKRYVDDLNGREWREGKDLVTEKAVYIWFKNARARASRKSQEQR